MKLIPKFQKGGKSYITAKGQKPFERSSLIPNNGNITPEQFFQSLPLNKQKQEENKPTYLPYNKKTDTFDGGNKREVTVTAPKKTIGTKQNPVKLPEVTVTANKPTTQTKLKPKGEVNQKVIEWQNKLKAEGFDIGKNGADGIWGKDTEAAYQAYLKNKKALEKVGLPQDNAPFLEKRQGFPTPASAYLKKGGEVKPTGGAVGKKPFINNKPMPKDNDENAIPIGNNKDDNNKKTYLKPKAKKEIKKPIPTNKKGGKMGKKKCACGCAIKISKNEKGGLIEVCACKCGGKMKKKK